MRTATVLDDLLVLDGRGGMTIQGQFPGASDGATLGTLYELSKDAGIRQIWITASALEQIGLPASITGLAVRHPFLEHGGLSRPAGQETLSSWMSVWGDGHFLEVSVPSWDSGSPFKSIDFGPELLGELLEFTDATGMLWKRSGAVTSDAWLRDHFAKNGLLRATEYPDIASDGNLEPDLHYMRAPEGKELRATRLLAYDANAMYLGAMSSLALPVGGFVEATPGDIISASTPGYWREGQSWMTTPTFQFGGAFADEIYYWPEHHRFLEPLYTRLRTARLLLLHRPDSAALEAVKQVYRMGIGRLGSTRRAPTLSADPLYQPYWRHAVIAEARCRLLRRIDTLAVKPVAVDVDCLYLFTSSKASPAKFAEQIGLPLDDQIGHFKFTGEMSGKTARVLLGHDQPGHVLQALREGLAR
jgi:hypothetical protein